MSASAALIRRVVGETPARVKDGEKVEILATVAESPGISRKRIASRIRCRPSTVSVAVQELLDDGLVVEQPGRPAPSRGRPEVALALAADRLLAVAVYVVSRQVRAALVNLENVILDERMREVPAGADNRMMARAVRSLVERLLADGASRGEPVGMSLSLPGYVDRRNNRWIHSARWPGVRNLDVGRICRGAGLPCVLTRFPDAELEHLVLEEATYRRGSVLLLHWGFGIGASYAHDGRVLQTAHGSFLEIGHWPVPEANGLRCACGAVGCAEAAAALWALAPELRKTHPDCPTDEYLFADYLVRHRLDRNARVMGALEVVARILAQLSAVFFPDHLLAFGPFLGSNELERRLRDRTLEQTARLPRPQAPLRALPGRFRGSVFGNVVPVFREPLRGLLTARW